MNAFRKLSQILYDHKRLCLLLAVIALALLAAKPVWLALAASGDLDPTFSGDGKIDNLSALDAQNRKQIAVQADGKTLVLTAPYKMSPYFETDFKLVRLNLNGSLDSSFDSDGVVVTDFSGNEATYDLALQPNGRIVVVGYSSGKIAIARYLPNGSLDSSFDGDGKLLGPTHSSALDVALQSDGKIVVAGKLWSTSAYPNNHQVALIARYNANGTLDTTFNPGSGYFATPGYVLADLPGSNDEFAKVVIQNDGKILVAGKGQLRRYTGTGQLDSTFGDPNFGVGAVILANDLEDFLQQNDGKIVTVSGLSISRYDAFGNLDPGFGIGGVTTLNPPVTVYTGSGGFFSLAMQEDGRLIVAGGDYSSGSDNGLLARVNSNGTLDTGFGVGGYVVCNTFQQVVSGAIFYALSLQADDRIVVAGTAHSFVPWYTRMARFKNDNTDTQTTDVGLGTITAAPTFPFSNTSWTYTIPVTNYSTTKAAHVTVTANVPTGSSFHSVTPPAGWAALQVPNVGATSGNISFSTSKLAPGATANLSFRVTIPSNTPSGTVILTIANVTNTIPDSNTTNNSASKLFYW